MSAAWPCELRAALRTLRARPAFALLVVLTLGTAIGGSTAMFGVVDATLLKPLPYASPERLVRIWETTPEGHRFSVSEPNFLDFASQNRSFDSMAAVKDATATLLAGEPTRLAGLEVSSGYFDTLGIQPSPGRAFTGAEDAAGAPAAVIVLSHALWTQVFAADPGIIGRTVPLAGGARTVIGVMPAGFDYRDAAFWMPLGADPASDRGDHWLDVIGRLQPGVSPHQAEAELAAIARQFGDLHPTLAGWGVEVASFRDWLVGQPFRDAAWLLFGAVMLLMLLACANVGGVLLAQAARRQAELGLRSALGAGRAALARQLLLEVGLLVVPAVALGIALAHGLVATLQRFGTDAIPRLDSVVVDARVLGFSIGLGLFSCVLFGAGPVLRASQVAPLGALGGGARAGVSHGQRRFADALVVAQVGLALTLLVGAGLVFRSLLELRAADAGYDTARLHAVELQLGNTHPEHWQKAVFLARVSERLEALPGIAAAGASSVYPFTGNNLMNDVTPTDRAAEIGPGGFMQANWRAVTPGFFDAAGLPLLRGALFDGSERGGPGATGHVVVSRAFAERMWPGADPVGKTFYWGSTSGRPRTVIGMVGDFQDVEAGAAMSPVMFLPYGELAWPAMTVLLRAHPGQALSQEVVRDTVQALAPMLPVPVIAPIEAQLDASIAGPRLRTLLFAAFALVALLLSAVGIYGSMASTASQRRRELGLRLALGARPAALVRLLLGSGLRLAFLGTAIGLAGAFAVAALLDSLLYGSVALDPAALLGGTALLAGVLLVAAGLPALRAARVDPVETLQAG